jgi:nucleotide-binding universal stress UspA family protein
MPNHILVPLDGSSSAEHAIPHAAAIAKAFDAEITLMNVLEQPYASLRMPKADPLDWYLKRSEAETYLNTMKVRLEKSHLSVKTVLLEGRATEQIVELAHRGNIDLVILSSHSGYDANGWAISSILQQILQQIGTSALIVRANGSPKLQPIDLHYQKILVPLDGSRRAGSALPLATRLAQGDIRQNLC